MPPFRKAGFYPPQPRPALPVDDEDDAGGVLNGVLRRLRDIDAGGASAPAQAGAAADPGKKPEAARDNSLAREASMEAKARPPSPGEPDYLVAVAALESVAAYQTDTFAPAEILSHDTVPAQDGGLADADADDERSVVEALSHAFAASPAAEPSIKEPAEVSPPVTQEIARREANLAVDVADAKTVAVATDAGSVAKPIMASPNMPEPRPPVAVVDEAKPVSPLDALALGLAAATLTRSPTPVVVEVPLTGAAGASEAPASARPPAPVRTLEDAVADMVRPMLQQWITDNMPRIVEKALRGEVAKLDAVKPPGT
jgi:cell pole-organizing protein PopZ